MKLYYFPTAPYSRKVLVAAYEKGIALDRQVVRPFDRDEMKRMRAETAEPLAQVPLLQLDDGRYLRESALIVEYLDRAFDTGPVLVPRDPTESLSVRAIDRLADVLLAPSSYLVWATRKAEGERNDPKIAAQRESFWSAAAFTEPHLAGKTFFHGDAITLADISIACAFGDMEFWTEASELKRFPNIARWYAAMCARPSWQRLLEESAPFAAALSARTV